jgi:hypothetical protein
MFKKVRNLFSAADAGEFDPHRPRDPYMDVLREMQASPPASRSRASLLDATRNVLARLTGPRDRSGESLPE